MVLQHMVKTGLLELLGSHVGGFTPVVAVQTRPPTHLPIHSFHFKPADKKRKRHKKGKDVFEEGEVIPSKELEPQKMAKIVKGAQRKSLAEGTVIERGLDCRPKVPIWNPTLELDGAPLPMDSSIREFQKGRAGYLVDALEQPLLLP